MTPGTGERSARRGLVHQDRFSARVIYDRIDDPAVLWFGLADRQAGKFDDFVVACRDSIVAHQFKKSAAPKPIGLTALLLGRNPAIAELAASYVDLRRQFPDKPLRLRYLDNSPASQNDQLVDGVAGTTTGAFLADLANHPEWATADWSRSRWAALHSELQAASGLPCAEFDEFWRSLDIVLGDAALPVLDPGEDEGRSAQIEELAAKLSAIIDDDAGRDRWTPSEMLQALGWRLRSGRQHRFPLASHVQRNRATEHAVDAALASVDSGYVALVGTPGSGKSTFLEREVRSSPGRVDVVRYLAFVPREAQGQGRGETPSFLFDVNRQLRDIGLSSPRKRDVDRTEALDSFGALVAEAGRRFAASGRRVDVVVDGLDHVPREEHPADSFLAVLPLPPTIPRGVRFILGTQRLEDLGLRPAVVEQAGSQGRRVLIAPLTEPAVVSLCDRLGLPSDVDRKEVFAAGRGHPLVSRYLIEQLKVADEGTRRALLEGGGAYGGEVEEVYRSALRGVGEDGRGRAVREVLAYLARVEGLIEPGLLAQAAGVQAVDDAWRQVGHLLRVADGRWEVFHNSFRLFLRAQPVLRFGQPDPAFAEAILYGRLGDLARTAPPGSPQRWLEFRYAFLAGDRMRARALARRAYFVGQYVEGRAPEAVVGDVRDAYRLHVDDADGSVRLFETMMTQDELHRREWVMESAHSLADAHLALADLSAAEAALEGSHPSGKEWTVIDALLAAGHADRARTLFESRDVADGLRGLAPPRLASQSEGVREWIARAVLFLDEEQLRKRLDFLTAGEVDQDGFDRAGFHADLRLSVARALLREGLAHDVDSLMRRWDLPDVHRALLLAQLALSSLPNDVVSRTNEAMKASGFHDLHPSWRIALAHRAADAGDPAVARELATDLSVEDLASIDPPGHSERAADATAALARHVILLTRVALPLPTLTQARQRLLRGAQSHVVALAEAIGLARAGRALPPAEAWLRASGAMRFVTAGRQGRDDDVMIGHLMGPVLEQMVDLAFDALPDGAGDLAAEHDTLLIGHPHGFGLRPGLRRQIALRQFGRDAEAASARRRLEAALTVLEEPDPQSDIEERVRFAIAFARTGERARARGLLAELRARALGIYARAKKDGQYQLWSTALALANAADPARREERGRTALRLVDGLERTEGASMAGRIARQVLFEAGAGSAGAAWGASKAAMAAGYASWDGIVDAALRGVVARSPGLLEAALRTWCHLALPWYGEPHGSTVDDGQFLRDLIGRACPNELSALLRIAVDAIERFARPAVRRKLLEVVRDAAVARGADAEPAAAAMTRWPAEVRDDGYASSDRSYGEIATLPAASAELRLELEADAAGTRSFGPSFGLRRRIAELVAARPWTEVRSFDAGCDDGLDDDVTLAIARRAIAEGDLPRAQAKLDAIERRGEGGWSYDRGRARLELHQLRHAIGAADAFEAARADFVGDLTGGRHGVSTSMWEVDSILPVLFRQVDWPGIWEALSEQLVDYRDYRIGDDVALASEVEDDEALIAELVFAALMLNASALQERAVRGAEALLPACPRAFARVVDKLLTADGEGAAVAARLLCLTAGQSEVRERFASELSELAGHPDLAVVLAAHFLASCWGVDLQMPVTPLPAVYALHLPNLNFERGIMPSSEGEAVMRPWSALVAALARASGVGSAQIARRAAQLAETELAGRSVEDAQRAVEGELERLGLRVTYHRPAAVIAMYALRCTAAELLRAGRMPERQSALVAHKLYVDPRAHPPPEVSVRPVAFTSPAVPRMMWGEVKERWLDAVQDDLRGPDGFVLFEWSRQTMRELRQSCVTERWIDAEHVATDELDDRIASLPRVVSKGGLLPLYDEDAVDHLRCARLASGSMITAEGDVAMFCPVSATLLGWEPVRGSPTTFIDGAGAVMAATVVWVDGVEQPINGEERNATGQRVVLSEDGWQRFVSRFGAVKGVERVCRRVVARDKGRIEEVRRAERRF